ncbi:hypothetical protein FHL15_007993 [Xylaria flabelliformis]|uniref:Aminoglycoside phosphotransferase domain-containing protein n=1 Tax=Xylaria flabelliformis TaxID=2512241 RepID=A0A553HSU0_9PEZI|nr:hypothetical protein FHL15_007993 [Xylaria flabelliformis]
MQSVGAQQLRDLIAKTRIHKERDALITSIGEKEVCNLASSYRRGDCCHSFKEPVRGSYNICFFVEFENGEKWVVRIPLTPCLAFGAKNKLESEIATMLVISERTSIPIPHIIAYCLDDDLKPLALFFILEYFKALASASTYTSILLQLAENAFAKSQASITNDEEQGVDAFYYLRIFRQYAERRVNHRHKNGPFVLVHGDLEPFNLFVDDKMGIVYVLDWEWTYDVVYRRYLNEFDKFLGILRTPEKESYGNELLSNKWDEAKADSGFLVANALENWTDIDWFAF